MFRLLMVGALTAVAPQAPVVDWIDRNATARVTEAMIGKATIVGLGESTHGTHEESVLKFRTLRRLVTEMGFRSIAWEEDWTTGVRINEYLLTGKGDLDALMREMTRTWHMREVRDVLAWLRAYNADHEDKVQFVGVEYYATRSLAYDAVASYVTKAAPHRLAALQRHLRPIRPRHENAGENLRWYLGVADKKPYIEHAKQVYRLVERLPRNREQELALQHARQILSWYEAFDLEDNYAYRDRRAAENLRWWQRRTGDKVAYWAASAHTANAPDLRVFLSGRPLRFDSAGSHLRRWYGAAYRSIGFTFDHGTLHTGEGCGTAPAPVPRPTADFVNRALGDAGRDTYALDLRTPAPEPVRAWMRAAKLRGYSAFDPAQPQGSYMTGGSLSQWFDVLVHTKKISSCAPL
ncbi:erythromycin esterase family protein [Nonomuraea sp. NPDC050404]|uniref:erythromycin esterase family protein n=1 Tax=Nonomuraea sp. NPDC050404 TaxID=3155783 RepID=UPI0033D17987